MDANPKILDGDVGDVHIHYTIFHYCRELQIPAQGPVHDQVQGPENGPVQGLPQGPAHNQVHSHLPESTITNIRITVNNKYKVIA